MTLREWQRPYGELPSEGEHNEIPPFLELTQKDFSNKELWEQVLYEGVMEGLRQLGMLADVPARMRRSIGADETSGI